MNGVFKKTLFIILSICLLSSFSLALENEYKNSLTKVELTKTGENSYSVNLYTQKKYSEPLKVIKKSDLNYYILLPETKNSAVQITSNNKDIRNVSTNLYPYAGADSNNGYTKININTSKPINFIVSTKTNQTAKVQTQNKTIASNAVSKTPEVQKKNLVSSNTAKAQLAPKVQEAKKQPVVNKTLEKKQSTVKKQVAAPVVKKIKQQTKQKQEPVNTQAQKQTLPVQETVQQPKIEEIIQQDIIEQQQNNEDVVSNTDEQEQIDDSVPLQEEIAGNEFYENGLSLKSQLKSFLYTYKIKIQNKLNNYGLNLIDLLLMLTAAVVSFFAMLFILNRKQNSPKLKSKVDLIGTDEYKKTTPVSKKENNGQYFIFDNNVKQTGFCNPIEGKKKNYELSSYNPDLSINYQRPSIEQQSFSKDESKNEYDIIQKILKEDSIIEFAPNEFQGSKVYIAPSEETVKKQDNKVEKVVKNVKNPIQKTVPIKKEIPEPVVLSSIEIAPERGFMCVSYNNTINLVGYIFDDVFAIYNFKQPKLENYDIRFRMSERDDKGATFIVKVDNTKMLVKVTKTSMNLEVVM